MSTSLPTRLDREHQARPDADTVDDHRARAAHAVLTPEVGAGELEAIAEEVGQRHPHFGVRPALLAVDDDLDLFAHDAPPAASCGGGQRAANGDAGEVAAELRRSVHVGCGRQVPHRLGGGGGERVDRRRLTDRGSPPPPAPAPRGRRRRSGTDRASPMRRSWSSASMAATPTRAKSPWRWTISSNAQPAPAGPDGTRTSTSSSSSSMVVVKCPSKKSSAGTTRSPRVLRSTSSAPVTTATAGSSALASAWVMLPPTVPRLRIVT